MCVFKPKLAYDIPAISQSLDLIHLMAYDLHGGWETQIGHHSQFTAPPGETEWYSTDYAVNMWLDRGCPPEKLVMGLPAYGRGFKVSGNSFDLGTPTTGTCAAGRFTGENGFR